MLEYIKTLSGLTGPSGWEDAVRDFLEQQARRLGHDCRRDPLGNLLVSVKGRKSPREPILLEAHMDEPGFMVEQITPEGLLKFGLTGNTAPRAILGRQVAAGDGGHRGVIGLKPIHLTTQEERKTLPKVSDLYIDLGTMDKAETEGLIGKGELGVFDGQPRRLGDSGLVGKAMSRSVACGILWRMMEQTPPVDVTLAFGVQHYVGSRGAYGIGAAGEGGVAVVLDLCPGGVTGPELPRVGEGPVVPAMDQKAIFDRALRERLLECAADSLPVQRWARVETAGDGGAIQSRGPQISVAAIYGPAMNPEAPMQRIDLKDVQGMYDLLLAFLEDER